MPAVQKAPDPLPHVITNPLSIHGTKSRDAADSVEEGKDMAINAPEIKGAAF